MPLSLAYPGQQHSLLAISSNLVIKYHFFSILLHPDRQYFAFTAPVTNNAVPAQWLQWTVVSQGIKTALPFVKYVSGIKVFNNFWSNSLYGCLVSPEMF